MEFILEQPALKQWIIDHSSEWKVFEEEDIKTVAFENLMNLAQTDICFE